MCTMHATRRIATLGLCSMLGLCAAQTGASAAATTPSAATTAAAAKNRTAAVATAASVGAAGALANPAIDADGYLRFALEAARHRAARRLTEDAFIAMSREPGTVILDARSREKYDELHVRGAVHLAFPDITVESLARLLPDRGARILIYCNNNFANAPGPFPTKLPGAALNLSTYVALYTYGYRNVWELGPLVDVRATRIEFASAGAADSAGR
jgi:phage shock protein E